VEDKARYDARCLELGLDPDAGQSAGFRGVSWDKKSSEWETQIQVDGTKKLLGRFEATARGEVDAALAYDAAVQAVGQPEKANFALQPARDIAIESAEAVESGILANEAAEIPQHADARLCMSASERATPIQLVADIWKWRSHV
jgi:hypothetical protein